MTTGLDNLSKKEYPGRVIVIGLDRYAENIIVVYAITGRSPSSQARKMVSERAQILVTPTDESLIKQGNTNLLIYPAISFSENLAVSNGKQTEDILDFLKSPESESAVGVLESALSKWDYEPDAPNFTPRISGCIRSSQDAALSIIKRDADGNSERNYYKIFLKPGQGKLMATYSGENRDPLPSFSGVPEDVFLQEPTAEDTASAVYEALQPKNRKKDFRVAVACVFGHNLTKRQFTFSIINRHERMSSA
ncbi:MAG: IMP cyclohydrolase [Candidatus Aminicenantes bacterium]|jgi:IMP cyclohydrolase